MPDIVVTVPKDRWRMWLSEGDLPYTQPTGRLYGFTMRTTSVPKIEPGERVYVVSHGRLRGFAPLVEIRVQRIGYSRRTPLFEVELVRGDDAHPVTIRRPIMGFRGWRYRDWPRETERHFADWMSENAGFPTS